MKKWMVCCWLATAWVSNYWKGERTGAALWRQSNANPKRSEQRRAFYANNLPLVCSSHQKHHPTTTVAVRLTRPKYGQMDATDNLLCRRQHHKPNWSSSQGNGTAVRGWNLTTRRCNIKLVVEWFLRGVFDRNSEPVRIVTCVPCQGNTNNNDLL